MADPPYQPRLSIEELRAEREKLAFKAQEIQQKISEYQTKKITAGADGSPEAAKTYNGDVLVDLKQVVGYINLGRDTSTKKFIKGKLAPVSVWIGRSGKEPKFGVVGYSLAKDTVLGSIAQKFGFVSKKSEREEIEQHKKNGLWLFSGPNTSYRIMITASQICKAYPDLGFCQIDPILSAVATNAEELGTGEFNLQRIKQAVVGKQNAYTIPENAAWGAANANDRVLRKNSEEPAWGAANANDRAARKNSEEPVWGVVADNESVAEMNRKKSFKERYEAGRNWTNEKKEMMKEKFENRGLFELLIFLLLFWGSAFLMTRSSTIASFMPHFIALCVVFTILIALPCLTNPKLYLGLFDRHEKSKFFHWIVLAIALALLGILEILTPTGFWSALFQADNEVIGKFAIVLWVLIGMVYIGSIVAGVRDDEMSFISVLMTALLMVHFVDVNQLGPGVGIFFIASAIVAFVYVEVGIIAGLSLHAAIIGFVAFFVLTGWGDIIGEKTDQATSAVDNLVPFQTISSRIKGMFSNIGLLLFNPQAWYENQFAKQGQRDEGATTAALEVRKIDIFPSSVDKGETVSVLAEIENLGKENARNIRFDVVVDPEVKLHGGGVLKVNGNPENQNDLEESKYENTRALVSGDSRLYDADIIAPMCAGTFSATASVTYEYTVVGSTSLAVMSRTYYDELRRQEKLTPKRVESVSSAGPFKITLQADRNQPIPVDVESPEAGENQFKFVLGIVNERDGKATILPDESEFYFPKELDPVAGECIDFVRKESSSNPLFDTYVFAMRSKNKTMSGKDLRSLGYGDVKAFTCKVEYNATETDLQIQNTLAIQANLSYQYVASRDAQFKVEKRLSEFVPVCDTTEMSKKYVKNIAWACGPGEVSAPSEEYREIAQTPKVRSTDASLEGSTCSIYVDEMTREEVTASNLPINNTKVVCSGSDPTPSSCGDGWTLAEQRGDHADDLKSAENVQSGTGTGQCYICYTRGSGNPIDSLRVREDGGFSGYRYERAGASMDLEGTWSDGYLFKRHAESITVSEPTPPAQGQSGSQTPACTEPAVAPTNGACPAGTSLSAGCCVS